MSKKLTHEEYSKQTSNLRFEISYLQRCEQNEATSLKINDLKRELKQIERNQNYQV